MMTNTLNPAFEEARKPLAYLGTRAELENEMLHIRVYDWDFFTADDLIGEADVPLNGLLEYGQVDVELTLDLPDTSQRKVRGKHPKKTVPAGRLSGQIRFEGRMPEYNQLGGGLVERKAGVTYLAVRLNGASKLIPADPNGSSDPFVTVDWDGMQQTSRVVMRTLEPRWRQTLYFPLKLVTLNAAGARAQAAALVRVFDMDEAGHDLLGSCEIPLHKVTAAEHAKIDDDLGGDGRAAQGARAPAAEQRLSLPGHKIQSTIDVELYFTPDLPLDIQLEEEAERRADRRWPTTTSRASRPSTPRCPSGCARARRGHGARAAREAAAAAGGDYDFDWEHYKRLVSAEDQDAAEHFFSEYLSPQQPPTEMEKGGPMHVARMVRCVTWADDAVVFKKAARTDVWQAPNFFLEMRKGDYEDHALLMATCCSGSAPTPTSASGGCATRRRATSGTCG